MKINNNTNMNFRGNFYETPHLKKAIGMANYSEKLKFKFYLEEIQKINDGRSFSLDFIKKKLFLICSEMNEVQKKLFIDISYKNLEDITSDFYKLILRKINTKLEECYPEIKTSKEKSEIINSYNKFPVRYYEIDEMSEPDDINELTSSELKEAISEPEDLKQFFRSWELFDYKNDSKNLQYYPQYDKEDVPLAQNLRPFEMETAYLSQYDVEKELYLDKDVEKRPKPNRKLVFPDLFDIGMKYRHGLSICEAIDITKKIRSAKIINYDDYIKAVIKLKNKGAFTDVMRLADEALLKRLNEFGDTVRDFDPKLLDYLLKHPFSKPKVVYRDVHSHREIYDLELAKDYDDKLQKKAEELTTQKIQTIEEQKASPIENESQKKDDVRPGRGVFINIREIDEELRNFRTDFPDYVNCVVTKDGRNKAVFDKYGARFFRELVNVYHDTERAKSIYESCQRRVWGGRFNACTLVDNTEVQRARIEYSKM